MPTSRSALAGTRLVWPALLASVFIVGGNSWLTMFADDKPGSKSARERLEELRKEREAAAPPAKSDKKAAETEYPWATPDDVDYIDTMLKEQWTALGFPLADDVEDGKFIRRASLHIIGRIPTLEESEAYLRDKSKDKREKLINRLLASDEYGKNWATIWSKLLVTDGNAGGNNQDVNPDALSAWLEKEFNRNTPWNAMVSEMIAGNGKWDENGAVNFLIANLQNNNSVQATSYLTRLFLSVQTQCTECHDHPWNEWKQEQFHGMNAFFLGTREHRVTTTQASGQIATDHYYLEDVPFQNLRSQGTSFERRNGLLVYTQPTYLDGRDIQALVRGEKARKPGSEFANLDLNDEKDLQRLLAGGESAETGEPIFLRKELAKVLTADDNKYFARSIVNRLWYHYLGHSFVKNVDDFDNGQDEPTMPELLDKLAESFKASGYDVKRLTKWICNSKAYRLSSQQRSKENEEAIGFFTFQLIRPMTPEQIYDSVLTLTEIHKTGKSANTAAERRRFLAEFQRTFGVDEVDTSTPKFNGTITQSLMMMNSGLMDRATKCTPGSFLHRVTQDNRMNDKQKVELLYLAALGRKPNSQEWRDVMELFRSAQSPTQGFEDVLWLLLNSAEFILNH